MSHITTMQTSVKFKNSELLSKTLENIPGGVVGTAIIDYYGAVTEVEMSVKTNQFERGIGFKKVGDVYEPRMDDYGHQAQATELIQQIQTQYRKFAVQEYYESKGYSVQTEDVSPVEAQIQIRGY